MTDWSVLLLFPANFQINIGKAIRLNLVLLYIWLFKLVCVNNGWPQGIQIRGHTARRLVRDAIALADVGILRSVSVGGACYVLCSSSAVPMSILRMIAKRTIVVHQWRRHSILAELSTLERSLASSLDLRLVPHSTEWLIHQLLVLILVRSFIKVHC